MAKTKRDLTEVDRIRPVLTGDAGPKPPRKASKTVRSNQSGVIVKKDTSIKRKAASRSMGKTMSSSDCKPPHDKKP